MEYYQKYKELKKEQYIFTYTGALNFKDVILLKELIEKILVIQSAGTRQKKRIINILIEALQNSFLHGESQTTSPEQVSLDCMLLVGKEDNTYTIVLGNFIKISAIPMLKEKLDKLIDMDLQKLKSFYLETLDRGELTEKGGASLGLVKMLIDSEKNSSYHFYPFDKEYSFFSIELRVPLR